VCGQEYKGVLFSAIPIHAARGQHVLSWKRHASGHQTMSNDR